MIRDRAVIVWLTVAGIMAGSHPLACEERRLVYTSPPLTEAQRQWLLRDLQRRWQRFQNPTPGMSVRDLYRYVLCSAEADANWARMEAVLALAEQMQDRDPDSRTYGNSRWYWGAERPEDLNAVEFTMQDAALLWMRHKDRLPAAARRRLERLIRYAVEGIQRHRVPESYTNIFLMKCWNCIALGEHTGRPQLAQLGRGLLKAWLIYTYENGIHEYISPTYAGVDLDSLLLLRRFAKDAAVREQAEAALRLVWMDIAANWFAPAGRLGGAHSRDYDYLGGHGYLDEHLRAVGWLPAREEQPPQRFAALAPWSPPDDITRLRDRTPRMVCQRWGPNEGQQASHWVGKSISLGVAGASYGPMDKPLTVNFAGGARMPMVNFFFDARNDPFGRRRDPVGGGHKKSLHLTPFITSVQRGGDALLFSAVSTDNPRFRRWAPNPTCLQAQLVLPRDGVQVWVGDRPSPLSGRPGSQPVALGAPLFIRHKDAAAAFRIALAADLQEHRAVRLVLHNDGNNLGAMTLSVVFADGPPITALAAVAIQCRVREGLDDADFRAFRQRFDDDAPRVEVKGEIVTLRSPAPGAELLLQADARRQRRLKRLGGDPHGDDNVLAVDGVELGRKILAAIEPVRSFARLFEGAGSAAAAGTETPVEVENAALIVPPFVIGVDPAASGGKFVWAPGERGGKGGSRVARALIPIRTPQTGEYRLWGRVLTPTPDDDSFYVLAREGSRSVLPRTEWHTGVHTKWEWTALKLSGGGEAFALPAGVVIVEIHCRENGAAIDQLVVTADRDWRPPTDSDE